MKFDILKEKRYLALAGLVSLFLGTILPYFKVSLFGISASYSLWKFLEGKISFSLIIVSAMFIFKDYIEKYVPKLFQSSIGKKIYNASSKLVIIPIIIIVLFVFILSSKVDFSPDYLQHGVGFYLLWLGVILMVAHVFLYKNTEVHNVGAVDSVFDNNNGNSNNTFVVQNNAPQNDFASAVNHTDNGITSNSESNNFSYQGNTVNSLDNQSNLNSSVTYDKITCPSCGIQTDSNALICPVCGSKMQ